MLYLPSIQGKFPVGVTTFAAPVRPPRPIGSAKLRRPHGATTSEAEPALRLEEVAFTAYYPADIVSKTTKKGVDWIFRPIKESLQGFSAFLNVPRWLLWPVVYLFGSFIKIPAYWNAPLLNPNTGATSSAQTVLNRWPLVIFSHGLGGSRTAYSQFCSRLAASGKVVLAVEHRDGSGTVCMPRSWCPDGKHGPRAIYYLRETDILWDDDSIPRESQPLRLRAEQLEFRHHEVYLTYSAFIKFIQNDSNAELETLDGSAIDRESWMTIDQSSGKSIIKFDENVALAGHSFGGCTALSILSSKPMEEHTPIPIEYAVVLDPWLEPIPSPGPAPIPLSRLGSSISKNDANSDAEFKRHSQEGTTIENIADAYKHDCIQTLLRPHPRMLVINSETFTLWKDHFARLQDVVAAWEPDGRRILTLVGSKHESFSDFPVLPILARKGASSLLDTTLTISAAFLDNKLDQAIEEELDTRKMEIQIVGVRKDGKPQRKLVGKIGEVIVH